MSAAPTRSEDQYTPTDAVLALGWLAWLEGTDLIDWFDDLWFLGALLVLLPGLAGLLTLAVRLMSAVLRRRWRRAGSVLAAVALVLVANLMFQSWGGADRLRLEAQRGRWEALLAHRVQVGGRRVVAAPWRDRGGAGVVNTFDYLVYDETDQIARPAHMRTAEWRRLARDPLVIDFLNREQEAPRTTSVRRVVGHFYIAEQIYP